MAFMRLRRIVREFDDLGHSIHLWELRLEIPGRYPRSYRDPDREGALRVFRFETRGDLEAHIAMLRNVQREITLEMRDEEQNSKQ